MSSAGQPENNDLTHRQGSEVHVRHPAGGARLRKLLQAARRGRLRLPAGQRHVLAAIQNELQADTELAAAFSAFTSVTFSAAMPKTERLPARSTLAGWRGCCRAALNRRIMIVVAVVAALAAVLALAPAASWMGGQHTSCEPAYAFAPACHGPSWAPGGRGRAASRSYLQPYRALGLRPPVMTMPSLVMSTLRKVLQGLFDPLTRRGRSFLAAGGAAVMCGLAIPDAGPDPGGGAAGRAAHRLGADRAPVAVPAGVYPQAGSAAGCSRPVGDGDRAGGERLTVTHQRAAGRGRHLGHAGQQAAVHAR